jgi:hypothetical protein
VLERAAVRANEVTGDRVILADDVDELLGLGGFGERREAPEVEVDDRDVRAVAGEDPLAVVARNECGDLGRDEAGELPALALDRFEEPCVRDRDRGLVGERLG